MIYMRSEKANMATDGAEPQNNIPFFQNKKKNRDLLINPENTQHDNIIYLINLKPNNGNSAPELLPADFALHNHEKKIVSLIKNENSNMVRNIIDDDDIFSNLSNEYKLILSELLSDDKVSGQKYIAKILDHADDELTLAMVKNKVIYNFLNRENKIKIIKKLLKNPWLPQEETKLILDIIGKNDRNILDNIDFQNKNEQIIENQYREHSSESNNESPYNRKRNKYDDFLTEF
jgi:hypothetical protein